MKLGDQQTDGDGAASFDLDLKRFADVTYRLTFDAEGFEAEGGRSVEDFDSARWFRRCRSSLVGDADGNLNWITAANGASRTVQFLGVDRALEPDRA